jgi:two-component system, sensor histidine kinase
LQPCNTLIEAKDELFVENKKIVVVEDDDLVASGLVSLLQGLGAEVRHFNNAEEALRQDDIASADYLIVDYALGGELTGLGFLLALQQRQHKPIRAVIITGETSSQFMKNVTDSPWPILHKPINFQKLTNCLRSFSDWEADISAGWTPRQQGGVQ